MSSGKEIQRRVKTGCVTCRKRHMKCDERKPQCKHCEMARRSCLYDPGIRRKHSNSESGAFQFAPDHVWLETPNEVTFVHHVQSCNTEKDEPPFSPNITPEQIPEETSPVSYMHNGTTGESPNTTIVDGISLKDRMEEFTAEHALPPINWASPYSNVGGSSPDDDPVNSVIVRRLSGSSIYTRGPRKPMTDPKAARLLHHYIDNLASWLDINDPQRHFATFVPHLALSCPILLHAVLAFSASHLSRLDASCDALTAVEYQDACIQGLIPALANPSTAMDNVLPLSTVILRMYEMMSYETDHQRHLRGCSSLFTHNRGNIGFRALKRTAFWTYVREEILVALPNSSPTNIRPKSWKNDIVWEGDTDYVRTNQITWLAAEVVDFCFGDPAEASASNWDELQREIDSWYQTLPETFQPLYIMHDSVPFPAISYLCTWHVVGMQFYHLAKVLLALHNPHHTSGLDFLHFARSVEAEILKHTIQICGMTKALGSKHPGVLVNAVQPLVLCGRCLKKQDQQLELVRMLRQIEQDTAWSTAQGVQSLQEAWAEQIGQ